MKPDQENQTFEEEIDFMIKTGKHSAEAEALIQQMSTTLNISISHVQVNALARMMAVLENGKISDIARNSFERHKLDGEIQKIGFDIDFLKQASPTHKDLPRLESIFNEYVELSEAFWAETTEDQ